MTDAVAHAEAADAAARNGTLRHVLSDGEAAALQVAVTTTAARSASLRGGCLPLCADHPQGTPRESTRRSSWCSPRSPARRPASPSAALSWRATTTASRSATLPHCSECAAQAGIMQFFLSGFLWILCFCNSMMQAHERATRTSCTSRRASGRSRRSCSSRPSSPAASRPARPSSARWSRRVVLDHAAAARDPLLLPGARGGVDPVHLRGVRRRPRRDRPLGGGAGGDQAVGSQRFCECDADGGEGAAAALIQLRVYLTIFICFDLGLVNRLVQFIAPEDANAPWSC